MNITVKQFFFSFFTAAILLTFEPISAQQAQKTDSDEVALQIYWGNPPYDRGRRHRYRHPPRYRYYRYHDYYYGPRGYYFYYDGSDYDDDDDDGRRFKKRKKWKGKKHDSDDDD